MDRAPKLHAIFCILLYLKTIVNPLGSFLAIDLPIVAHTGPNSPRMCVKTDLTLPRPEKLGINVENEDGFWKYVEYEKTHTKL